MAADSINANVRLRDVSDDLAVIGVWGTFARDVLSSVTDDDVSGAALPFGRALPIKISGARVLAQRITFVGELGFELYLDPEWAVQIWDRLFRAGGARGIRAGGYRVLDSLRIEKGYRYYGMDLTAADTPYGGGVGFCAAEGREFVGAGALAAARAAGPRHRLRTLLVGDGPDYLPLYGGEAVRLAGGVVGRVRSCAYGFSVRRNVALATLPPDLVTGAAVTVEVLGEPVEASVAAGVLHDPDGARFRLA